MDSPDSRRRLRRRVRCPRTHFYVAQERDRPVRGFPFKGVPAVGIAVPSVRFGPMRIDGLELQASGEGVPWRATRSEGVEWHLLASDGRGEEAGATVLIRMQPGCGYPPHEHLGLEEVLVLAGGYRDHLGEHTAGHWIRYEPGSRHAPVALGGPGDEACLLYAISRGGIRTLGDQEAAALG